MDAPDTAKQIVIDLHRAVRHSCGVGDYDRMSYLDTKPFIARIEALARKEAEHAIEERNWQDLEQSNHGW